MFKSTILGASQAPDWMSIVEERGGSRAGRRFAASGTTGCRTRSSRIMPARLESAGVSEHRRIRVARVGGPVSQAHPHSYTPEPFGPGASILLYPCPRPCTCPLVARNAAFVRRSH